MRRKQNDTKMKPFQSIFVSLQFRYIEENGRVKYIKRKIRSILLSEVFEKNWKKSLS